MINRKLPADRPSAMFRTTLRRASAKVTARAPWLSHLGRFASDACDFATDQRGVAVIYTGLTFFGMVGFAGMAVEPALWFVNKRSTQSMADAAALAGALEVMRSQKVYATNAEYVAAIAAAAQRDAVTNGFVIGEDTIQINYPPSAGAYSGEGDAVEVVIRTSVDRLFTRLFSDTTSTTIEARAVATVSAGEACVWALNPSARAAVDVAGGAIVNRDCGMRVNSDHPTAYDQHGSGCLIASDVKVRGGWNIDCAQGTPPLQSGRIYDPLASFDGPTITPPCVNEYYEDGVYVDTGNSRMQLNDGTAEYRFDPGADGIMTLCEDLSISAGHVIFEPGTYVLDGMSVTVNGGAEVDGTGVFFYVRPDNSNDAIDIAGGADVDLTAPTSGDYEGMLLFQERNTGAVTHKLTGGSEMQLSGTVYLPESTLEFAGGTEAASNSLFIVTDMVKFTGNSSLNPASITPPDQSALIKADLVE